MNLYLFPEAACLNNGYSIAVNSDYLRLQPSEEDTVVWLTNQDRGKMLHVRSSDFILQRPSWFSYKSISNVLHKRLRGEPSVKDFSFLKGKHFDYIFCGDKVFYRILRAYFPTQLIHVRYHNCWARILDRSHLLNLKLDWKYELGMKNEYLLERQVFNDKATKKIFISVEDRDYYTSHFGKTTDSEVWPIIPNIKVEPLEIQFSNKLVWYGGVESHKLSSIRWFIENVYPSVKEQIPSVEFHLWGKNTEGFDDRDNCVYGHGFYQGDGMPLKDALYVNPDIIGGGVKVKLASLIENRVAIISTPFGFEGYDKSLIVEKTCMVVEMDEWAEKIVELLRGK